MAVGKLKALRLLVVNQAQLFSASASAAQVREYVETGWLECDTSGEPPPVPYDPVALKMLVSSGRMG